VQQISIRDVIHPARYWVGDKGQNQSGDGMIDLQRRPQWSRLPEVSYPS
jgi:hypothetical protein